MEEKLPQKVRLQDIARRAGVSMMTVSRVLNNHAHVNPETRTKVLKTANELGYVPHATARALASGKTRMLGLVVGALYSEYVFEIMRGVNDETREQSNNLVLVTSGQSQEHELKQISHLMGGMVDGIMLVLPREAAPYLEVLSTQELPIVLIDHRSTTDRLPAVRATNFEGMHEATRYLIQLGHRRIGYIKGIADQGTTIERYRGYLQALKDAAIDYDEDLIRQGDYEQSSGYRCTHELMEFPDPPTAIIASNDQMAFGAYSAIREMDLVIPEDVSLIGFDDVPSSATQYPPLTTVHQPLYEMGRTAVRMVISAIRGEPLIAGPKYVPTHLVIRSSTGLAKTLLVGEKTL